MATQGDTRARSARPRETVQALRVMGPTSIWISVAALAVVALYLLVPLEAGRRYVMGNVLLTGLPLASAVACGLAARRAPLDARLPWMLFAAAAVVATLAQLAWIAEQQVASGLEYPGQPSALLFPLFHPVFMAGIVMALRWDRVKAVLIEIVLDGALVMLAGIIVVLRVAVEPVLRAGVTDTGPLTMMVIVAMLALVSLFVASLLVVWHSSAFPRQAATGLFLAAFVFVIGNIAGAAGADPNPTRPGDAFDLIWLTGWGTFLWAGVAGGKLRSVPLTPGVRRLAPVVRNAVVPGITAFLALAVVDVAFSRPLQPTTALFMALLGGVLALRVGHALTVARRSGQHERRYTHAQVLIQISHSLAGATDLDEIFEMISGSAKGMLDAGSAGIELLSDDGKTLVAKTALGLPAEVVGMQFPVDGSFTGWTVRHGRARATADPSADPFIQPKSLRYLGHSPVAAVPLRFGQRTFGALYAIRDRPFDDEEVELLAALAEQAAVAMENARLFEQVIALSLTDPLTGLANRRQLERDIAREFAAARRGRRLVAVMFDLDGFKEYNDRYGHPAGDQALRTFAEALRVETRAMNLAARYGGDEFLTLLSDGDATAARIFIERVAQRFSRESAALGRDTLSVSAGIAVYDPAMNDWLELIEAADRDLYRSKPAPRSST